MQSSGSRGPASLLEAQIVPKVSAPTSQRERLEQAQVTLGVSPRVNKRNPPITDNVYVLHLRLSTVGAADQIP